MSPRFSIVMPTHNREELLPRALSSVLAQTETSWELFVVNDGDRDVTDLVAGITGTDPRVQVLRTEGHRGAAHARNIGIRAARGEIVTFLDDDDEYDASFLAAIQEHIKPNRLDLVWTGVTRTRTTSRGKCETRQHIWQNHCDKNGSLAFILEIGSCGLAIRRKCFERHGSFDESLRTSEDRDLLLRFISRGCRYAALPKPLLIVHAQRMHGLSQWSHSAVQAAASARDDETVIARYQDFIGTDLPLRRSYLQRLARKHYRAQHVGEYWATARALAAIGGLSFKLIWRGIAIFPLRFLSRHTTQPSRGT